MDVYGTVENILEHNIPLKHRYILSELNESQRIQISTTNWDTHYRIQEALKNSALLENTYSESWCEGTPDATNPSGNTEGNGLEHGDIQVIDLKVNKYRGVK